jgi:hypothetical protein
VITVNVAGQPTFPGESRIGGVVGVAAVHRDRLVPKVPNLLTR